MSSTASQRNGGVVAAGAILLSACALHIHQLLGGRTFIRDTSRFDAPAKHFLAELIRGNELPRWWPWDGLGSPFLAQPVFSVFHPTTLFYRFLPFWTAFAAQDFAATLMGLSGTYLLARALHQPRTAAFVAAVAFAASGYIFGQHEHQFAALSAGTAPWYLVAILLAVRRGRRWLIAPAAALGLLLLAGEPQIAILTSIAGLVLAVAEEASFRAALIGILSPAMGGALAAVQLLPSLSLVRETERASQAPDIDKWPLDLPHALGLIVPIRNDGFVFHTDFGLPLLALAAAGSTGLRRDRKTTALLVLLVMSLWLALGGGFGLSELFRAVVPVWSKLRYPIKSLALAMLMLALLAGEGMRQLQSEDRRRPMLAGGIAAAVLFAFVSASIPSAIPSAMLLTAETALIFALPVRFASARVLIAVPIIVTAVANLPTVKPEFYAPSPIVNSLKAEGIGLFGPAYDRLDDHHFDSESAQLYDAAGGGGGNSLYGAMFDLPALTNYVPGASARLKQSWDSHVGPAEFARLAGVFGVGYLVVTQKMADGNALGESAVPIAREPVFGYSAYRLEEALPRAYAVRRALTSPTAEAAGKLLRSDSFHPAHEIVIEAAEARPDWANRPETGVVKANIAARTDSSVSIDVELPWDGFVVLNEAYFSGWTVTIDHQPATPLIANGFVRAVEVKAGRHQIEWRYEAPGLKTGAIVSVAGWIGLLIACVLL